MFPNYRQYQNAFAFGSIKRTAEMPKANMAVAGDDEMSSVPLTIQKDASLRQPIAVKPNYSKLAYEQTAEKGAGDTLALENFVTDDFNLGGVVANVI